MSTASAPSEQQEPGHGQVSDPDVASEPVEPAHEAHAEAALGALARLDASGAATPPRRRVDVKLLLASMGIAIGLVVMVLGFLSSVTGDERQALPDAIESIDPVRDATQVPQQTRVFVDFVIGYEGVIVIDGLELPVVSLDDVGKTPPGLAPEAGDQIEIPPGAVFEPGNATLTFEPGPSQPIESFTSGVHTVTVRYWRTEDGPSRFRTFTFNFYAV